MPPTSSPRRRRRRRRAVRFPRRPRSASATSRSWLRRHARVVARANLSHERGPRGPTDAERQDDFRAPRRSDLRVGPAEVTRRVEVQERRPPQPEDAGSPLAHPWQGADLGECIAEIAEIVRSGMPHRSARADDSARHRRLSLRSSPRAPRRPGGIVERVTRPGYFFAWQTLVEACQSPPAFSQSAWVVIVDSDLPVVPPDDGLAEGDVDGPVDGADIEPEPVVPELP